MMRFKIGTELILGGVLLGVLSAFALGCTAPLAGTHGFGESINRSTRDMVINPPLLRRKGGADSFLFTRRTVN